MSRPSRYAAGGRSVAPRAGSPHAGASRIVSARAVNARVSAVAAIVICVLAAAVVAGLAGGLAPRALAATGTGHQAGSGRQAAAVPVAIGITSLSPQVAAARGSVTVSGQLTNVSAAAVGGVSVWLRWSSQPLNSRGQLQLQAAGQIYDSLVPGAVRQLRPLAAGATADWSISVPVLKLQLSQFGVYPLSAQAVDASGTPLAASRTFLPYWPKHAVGPRPEPLNISWILPLMDKPEQTACPGLLTDALAASVAPGGRLYGLLAAGAAQARQSAVAWAIDPSLLSSVQTMSRAGGYSIGGTANCDNSRHLAASRAAATWLAKLKAVTASAPGFVTPYADVDIGALTRQNLDEDLDRAILLGRSAATSILGRDFPAAGNGGSAGAGLAGFAWPANGVADYSDLGNLAAFGIKTVVLDSSVMPPSQPQQFTPSAVTSTANGVTGDTRVLLSDSSLTQLLGSAHSGHQSAAANFALRQQFLAETAIIAAEAPSIARAIVVAPPRRWDPPAGLTGSLLAETTAAPWLRPVALGRLAAATPAAGQVRRAAPARSSRSALDRVLVSARTADRRVQLLTQIIISPPRAALYDSPAAPMYEAIAAAESSAWRGRKASAVAAALLRRVSGYVSGQLSGVSIIPSGSDTLGALRGTVPVSIRSRLSYPVRVRLTVVPTSRRLAVNGPGVITVPAGKIQLTRIKVHAASVGPTGITLGLATPDGRPLPGTTTRRTVQATQFGTLALVIVAAALGVFTISSAGRAIRRGRGTPGSTPGTAGSSPAAGAEAAVAVADTAGAAADGSSTRGAGAGSVISGDAGRPKADSTPMTGQRGVAGPSGAGGVGAVNLAPERVSTSAADDRTEETDDYAPAPGRSDRS